VQALVDVLLGLGDLLGGDARRREHLRQVGAREQLEGAGIGDLVETGEDLQVEQGPPEGALPRDLPPQPAVFAPDYAPEEIAEIAQRLRKDAGFPDKSTAAVANGDEGLMDKVKDKLG
jgi:hypothetical protein